MSALLGAAHAARVAVIVEARLPASRVSPPTLQCENINSRFCSTAQVHVAVKDVDHDYVKVDV